MEKAEYFGNNSKLFTGRYIDAIPELREQGLTPVTPAMVMDRRIEAAKSNDKHLIDELWDNYFDTAYGLAATKDRIYLQPDSGFLLSSSNSTRLTRNGIPISIEADNSFKITERKEHILNERLTQEQARQHRLWLELADNNQDRLDSYAEQAFRLGKDKHGYKEMMGFYVPEDENPILRAVFLTGLNSRSSAYGFRNLDGNDARLVGVAQNFSAAHLEEIVKEFGINNQEELRKAVELYKIARKLLK